MVVLLVILTFAILLTIGAIMDYSRKHAEEKQATPVVTMGHVFAQDGGEEVEKETKEE